MGIQAIPMRADSGPIGGDDTHEFLVLAETGESEVFYDSAVTDLTLGDRAVDYDNWEEVKAFAMSGRRLMPGPTRPMTMPSLPRCPKSGGESRAGSRLARSSISGPSIPSR